MHLRKKLILLLVCLVLPVGLYGGAARAEVVDRTVANVNGEIILYSEVQEQLKMVERFVPEANAQDPEKRPQIEREILNQLIRQKLTEQEAKRLKVVVSKSEIDDVVASVLQENKATPAQFERALKENGQSMEKFREGIRKELERNRLVERALKSKVVITDQQVEAYLKSDQGDTATTSERIRLGIIFLPLDEKSTKADRVEQTGREILEKIKGGTSFEKMAKEYSKGPAAEDGGDIGFMPANEMAPYIAQAVKNLKQGEVSGLVRGPNGFYIVKVSDIDRTKQSRSDPSLREKIRAELTQKEVNRRFEEWVRNLESKAFIQTSL